MHRFFQTLLKPAGVAAAISILVLLLQPALYAQSSGILNGTVYDQTGAVIPKAKVTLINQATNDERQTVSNEVGYFSFPAVQPGTYGVRIEAPGFKTWQQKGIVMRPGDTRNVSEIAMQVGHAGEAVTVEAVASEVKPVDSGERSDTLTYRDIQNLSLQGRDVTELIRTLPGFSAFNGGGSANTVGYDPSVASFTSAVGNGYTANGNVYRGGSDLTSDGAHVIDAGCNCSSTKMLNADMISEVKVQTSNFGADSAKGPVVVNTVGKSGTTAYHGSAYLYARNGAMNSLDYNAGKNGVKKPEDQYFYPGGQLGGPVPGTKKKMLFFSGFEYYYQSKLYNPNNISTSYVPTLSNRNGDFSLTAADNLALCGGSMSTTGGWPPWCRVPQGFDAHGNAIPADGIIPSSMWDPAGVAFFNMFPLPNADPTANPQGYNYINQIDTDKNGWALRNRVDYNLTENTKFFASWDLQKLTEQVPIHLWWTPTYSVPYPGGLQTVDKSNTITAHFVHVFSPTLTNEATFSYNLVNFPLMPNDLSLVSREKYGYPYGGIFENGDPLMPTISNGYWQHFPHMDQGNIFRNGGSFVWKKGATTFEDNVAKVIRTHTFKVGFYAERTLNNQASFTHTEGQAAFGFNGPYTGPYGTVGTNMPMANILLGVPETYFEDNYQAVQNMHFNTLAAYVMDSWKVARRLTFDIGFRFDHIGPWLDATGQTGLAVWTPANYASDIANGITPPGLTWMAKNPGVPNGGWNMPFAYVSPRLGMAWDIFGTGKTVFRGGWGTYRWADQWNNYGGALETAHGVKRFTTSQATPLWAIDAMGKAGQTSSAPVPASGTGVLVNDARTPVTYSWNATISQQVPWNSLLEVAYVGNRSADMVILGANGGGLSNINYIPLGALLNPDPVTGAPADPANADRSHYRLFGTTATSLGYGNNNLSVTRHAGIANYNGLQVSWVKRAGRVAFNLNYAWSKALGTWNTAQLGGDAPDLTNYRNDYGPLSTDRSHVVNMSYSFDLGTLVRDNKFLGGVANGWTISGITSWQSGPNMQAIWNSNMNLQGVTGNSATVDNLHWLGTPDVKLMPILTCDPTSNLKDHQYINGACFTLPALPTQNADGSWNITNGPFQMPYIHGPAFFNSDLSVYKTFKLTERQNVQFRASAFNFLNHPIDSFDPGAPAQLTFSDVGHPGTFTAIDNTFGYATTKLGRRVVELSLKYTF
jgi:hypothetical protein